MGESTKGDIGRKLAHKALMPIVATAATAVAGYAAKKGPDLFEEKLLPKLKQAAGSAGSAAQEIPSRAKAAAGDAGDITEDLAGRVKDAAPGGGGGGQDGDGGGAGRRRNGRLSQTELEQHAKRRAEARAARRKTTPKR
ncbi:MAG: hypothetical protein ACJ77E_10100 [Gaiellaceae bacterium]